MDLRAAPCGMATTNMEEDKKPCCRLLKSLYGHPESGRLWEQHLEEKLNMIGFKRIPCQLGLWKHKDNGAVLTTYVDDLLLVAPNVDTCQVMGSD